jgi:hypothetical protein
MTWQEASLFAVKVYGIAAVVSLFAAAVLHLSFKALKKLSRE